MTGDTSHLSPHDFGAYWRLLCWYYRNGPLPTDDESLINIIGAQKADWARCRGRIMDFFDLKEDGLLHQKCADEVIQKRNELAEKRRKQTAEARKARHVTPHVTEPVTSSVTSVQSTEYKVQSTENIETEHKEQTHTHPPTPLKGVKSVCDQKKEFQDNGRFQWLSETLCRFYKRPRPIVGRGEEEHLVSEISRRYGVKDEWVEIRNYRQEIGEKFFPQSLKKLCQEWEATLDKARNHRPSPKPYKELSIGEKEIDRMARAEGVA